MELHIMRNDAENGSLVLSSLSPSTLRSTSYPICSYHSDKRFHAVTKKVGGEMQSVMMSKHKVKCTTCYGREGETGRKAATFSGSPELLSVCSSALICNM